MTKSRYFTSNIQRLEYQGAKWKYRHLWLKSEQQSYCNTTVDSTKATLILTEDEQEQV